MRAHLDHHALAFGAMNGLGVRDQRDVDIVRGGLVWRSLQRFSAVDTLAALLPGDENETLQNAQFALTKSI